MFDLLEFLTDLAARYDLQTTKGRRAACEKDPMAFSLIYLPDLLRNEQGEITFSEAHFEWYDLATGLIDRSPSRDAFVAPRGTGKSTIWFNIIPIWAACFGHARYIAAFASAAGQAWSHLSNIKRQFDTNQLLRLDFPEVCNPAKRPNGRPVADSEARFVSVNGIVIDADGIDSNVAGKNVNGRRPDLMILDDIEPDESNYGPGLKEKRLRTLLDNIFPLNVAARVIILGTVTMPDSIIHDLVKSLTEEPDEWVTSLRPAITVHHQLPILTDQDGNERSFWPGYPERFGLDLMQELRNTPSFLKNYMNSPLGAGGSLWSAEDFIYGDVEGVGGLLVSIDPAVTTKSTSDFTAVSLIGWSKAEAKVVVYECWEMKVSPEKLAERVNELVERYPVAGVLVETNQGHDLWKTIFKDLEVPLHTVTQSDSKEVRAARIYTAYNRGKVHHAKRLTKLEAQLCAFPKAPHDDMVDSVCSGIAFFLNQIKAKRRKGTGPSIRQHSYL